MPSRLVVVVAGDEHLMARVPGLALGDGAVATGDGEAADDIVGEDRADHGLLGRSARPVQQRLADDDAAVDGVAQPFLGRR